LFLWVDGVPTTLSKIPDTRPIQAGANATSSIGHSPPPTGMSGFLGTLDEVAIYSTALDAGSIQHHYQVGLGNE